MHLLGFYMHSEICYIRTPCSPVLLGGSDDFDRSLIVGSSERWIDMMFPLTFSRSICLELSSDSIELNMTIK